jgi:hypothetical protein
MSYRFVQQGRRNAEWRNKDREQSKRPLKSNANQTGAVQG